METPEYTTPPAKVRKLTVCNKSFPRVLSRNASRYIALPVLTLTGKWLLDSGFEAGHVVDITCEDRKLIITISKEQRFEGF